MQPFSDLLPGKLLSYLEAADDEVAAAAKEVAQHLKKAHPSRMPKVLSKSGLGFKGWVRV